MKLNYYLMPYNKVNSKEIIDLNIRVKTLKLLVENIEDLSFYNLGPGKDFLGRT